MASYCSRIDWQRAVTNKPAISLPFTFSITHVMLGGKCIFRHLFHMGDDWRLDLYGFDFNM